ncbi:MAG TPA: hypothetical protein VMW01_13030 [Williamwhitmania sp.]|nr:hypothetical protein [Williamwhitmania sp.]
MKKPNRKSTSNFLFLAILALVGITSCIQRQPVKRIVGLSQIPSVAFVLPNDTASLALEEKNDLSSLKMVLNISGLRYTEIPDSNVKGGTLASYNLVVVPFATAKALDDSAAQAMLTAIKSGNNILVDGPSTLATMLGVKFMPTTIAVSHIRDTHFSGRTLYWTTTGEVNPFDNAAGTDSVLAYEEATHQPIAVSGSYGKGRFISIATLFDPNTPNGTSRFPFLIEWLEHNLGVVRIAERGVGEIYFDPENYDTNILQVDSLARLWRERKIKRIYAAGWYYDTPYDYRALIKACHANGIQIYCWLETPEVTRKMWDEHPAWREKTATGRDAFVDWRRLMNMADDSCRKQVFRELDGLLMQDDWDGVNFAEMYFEPDPDGFNKPENFTPMNRVIRNEFEQQEGFDPQELFNISSAHYWKRDRIGWRKFADYRKDLAFRIKDQFLNHLMAIKHRKRSFEVMLTGIDVSLRPEDSDNIAESTENTLALCKKYDISLQIEDPSMCWSSGPERFEQLGRIYRKSIPDENRLIFDCNVVVSHEHGEGGFPSEWPSGEELRQITYNIALHNIRPAFYSEDVINVCDYRNISTVLAREAIITERIPNEWEITTPYTITVNVGLANLGLTLDGKPWFARNGQEVIIPKGKHMLRFYTKQTLMTTMEMEGISGELKWASFAKNRLEFTYNEATTPCYVILDRKPSTVNVDGMKANVPLMGDGDVVLKLPQGEHTVTVWGNVKHR